MKRSSAAQRSAASSDEEPLTTKAQRRAKSHASPTKAQHLAESDLVDAVTCASDLQEYLERWRNGEKTRGGGSDKEHTTDMILVQMMQTLVKAKVAETAQAEALHSVVICYGVGRCFSASNCGMPKTNSGATNRAEEVKVRRAKVIQCMLPMVQHLQQGARVLERTDDERVVAAVDGFADLIEATFQKRNLSAASKLLCMLGLEVPIYDSLARKALGLNQPNVKYSEYLAKWTSSYEARRTSYLAAVRSQSTEEDRIGDIVSAEWVAMRAHDMRLMRLGYTKAK
jgi:hypothetical protein